MPTVKTKTSPSGLTPEEQQELERRGFLVKKNFTVTDIITQVSYLFTFILIGSIFSLGLCLLAIPIGAFIINEKTFDIILIIIGVFPPVIAIMNFIYSYIRTGTQFITKKGRIEFGEANFKNNKYLFFISFSVDKLLSSKDGWLVRWLATFTILIIPAIVIIITIFHSISKQTSETITIISVITIMVIILISPIIILSVIKLIYQSLHPLYAFGNLGSRIQSLTPRISETSEKIEKEFSTDMNFRTLSRSFDTLSKDFSEISSYVLKLEQIEKKANKGNLFDSEKYIGSLREDIVKPLTTLRSFLKKKKTELEASEQEMKKVRVRVGGSGKSGGNGEIENLELQSKRSEPLREELTENISKLDIMIERFGKI